MCRRIVWHKQGDTGNVQCRHCEAWMSIVKVTKWWGWLAAIDRPLREMTRGQQNWPPLCRLTSYVGTHCTPPGLRAMCYCLYWNPSVNYVIQEMDSRLITAGYNKSITSFRNVSSFTTLMLFIPLSCTLTETKAIKWVCCCCCFFCFSQFSRFKQF